jgi:hypothetical protein
VRRFELVRDQDVSGVSGVGIVAEGVQFHDGQVSVSWFGAHHCVSVWPHIDDVTAIHGHGGLTRIVWLDEEVL